MPTTIDIFRHRLSETLRWCLPRLDLVRAESCFRSKELQPRLNVVHECRSRHNVDQVVAEIVARRSALLGPSEPTNIAIGLRSSDRLFAFDPTQSLCHGSSPPVSDGYIDEYENAPWDTWITSTNGLILSWVPNEFVELVESAILVNPEECIRWAAEWHDPAVDEFQREVFSRVSDNLSD